jgi:prolyl-tRNA editing enzyme YbaK/EbsC (Cys-tRNA(Pro) deacylase)
VESEASKFPESVQKVKLYLSERNLDAEVRLLAPESTRTSSLAAQSLGCSVAEIAKTVCFILDGISGSSSPKCVLVTLSGDKRVDIRKVSRFVQAPSSLLRKMNADEVKDLTGYSIGGVPPFPHKSGVEVFVDDSPFRFETVWAAAGAANAVMRINPKLLTEELKLRRASFSE